MDDPFLSRDEKTQIRKMYDHWTKHAKAELLVDKLYPAGLLHEREREECLSKQTSYDKNRYLYDIILSRSTYERICEVRTVLSEMDNVHKSLAGMLPVRSAMPQHANNTHQGGQYQTQGNAYGSAYSYGNQGQPGNYGYSNQGQWNQNPPQFQGHQYGTHYPNHNYPDPHAYQQPYYPKPNPSPNPGYQGNPVPNPGGENSGQQRTNVGGDASRGPGSNSHTSSQSGSNPAQPYQEQDPKYNYGHEPRQTHTLDQPSSKRSPRSEHMGPSPKSSEVTEGRGNTEVRGKKKLNVYPTRPGNPETGKGLCVIFANFIDDLVGYSNDIKEITKFFGETLKYTVLGGEGPDESQYRDLTAQACKMKLQELKKELENGKYKSYDRFFLFVLSHGDEMGIKMIPPNDEGDSWARDRITSEYLVDSFAHGQLPNMKGYPKCFFIQVCSGNEVALAANSAGQGNDGSSQTAPVAVGADTLVCHASKQGKYSFVSQGEAPGSWFLQACLKVFQDYYDEEHLLDLLTEVNDRVSKKYGLSRVATPNSQGQREIQKVYQLPAISNSLTKKLYLGK